jgi:cytochrome b561
MTTAPSRYTRPAIALHWVLAVLIIANLCGGLYMTELAFSPQKLKYYSWHKWVGVTVFVLSALRLLWRLRHPAPPLPEAMPAWQRTAADASHRVLYALFFAVPIAGWMFSSASGFPVVWFGVLQIPDLVGKDRELAEVLKLAHRSLAYGLGLVVVMHIAAALKHHFVDRDDVLQRILPDRKLPESTP